MRLGYVVALALRRTRAGVIPQSACPPTLWRCERRADQPRS
jgi:hypothetical protein